MLQPSDDIALATSYSKPGGPPDEVDRVALAEDSPSNASEGSNRAPLLGSAGLGHFRNIAGCPSCPVRTRSSVASEPVDLRRIQLQRLFGSAKVMYRAPCRGGCRRPRLEDTHAKLEYFAIDANRMDDSWPRGLIGTHRQVS